MRELLAWALLAVFVVALWAFANGAGWLLWPLFVLVIVPAAWLVIETCARIGRPRGRIDLDSPGN